MAEQEYYAEQNNFNIPPEVEDRKRKLIEIALRNSAGGATDSPFQPAQLSMVPEEPRVSYDGWLDDMQMKEDMQNIELRPEVIHARMRDMIDPGVGDNAILHSLLANPTELEGLSQGIYSPESASDIPEARSVAFDRPPLQSREALPTYSAKTKKTSGL